MIDLQSQIAIRWSEADAKLVPLFRQAHISAVITKPNAEFEAAAKTAQIAILDEKTVRVLPLEKAAEAPGPDVVVKAGVWPGLQRPDPQVASATRAMWLDQNCNIYPYLRAVYPKLPRVLGYLPDKDAGVKENALVPFESYELALAEAWTSGGNYVLGPDKRFRDALAAGEARALTAWKNLGRTAAFLQANRKLFQQPPMPIVTVLVDKSDFSQEIAQLCFRQSVSPELVDALKPPPPDPANRKLITAVSIDDPKGEAKQRILASAEAGSTVVVEGEPEKGWWWSSGLKLVRSDAVRNYFALGKGQLVAYKESISDPGNFALDVIDLVSQKTRPARLWNLNGGLAMASKSVMTVLNYSRMQEDPVLARIQGKFTKATLLRPESAPIELRVAPRGTGSEVQIPNLLRLAVIVFS